MVSLTYDASVDAAYIRLSTPDPGVVFENIEVALGEGNLILDVDESGKLFGIEILAASRLLLPAVLEGMDREL